MVGRLQPVGSKRTRRSTPSCLLPVDNSPRLPEKMIRPSRESTAFQRERQRSSLFLPRAGQHTSYVTKTSSPISGDTMTLRQRLKREERPRSAVRREKRTVTLNIVT
ncbi:hypothetical protein R1flu_024886 [Riccia fluitans]|uniref:Uncharacterized protein n=1 Tax=Riccia fluitans TaxID=41844 RepID=A0ABD1XW79_9MARC